MPAKAQKKSKNWLNKQNKDVYVKNARQQQLRARSSFKLQDIDKKYKLIKPNTNIIDLGAAPGSWSQYVTKKIGANGILLSVDLLDMLPLKHMQFIQGDFTEQCTQQEIMRIYADQKIDLVLSDMAPNITGITIIDQSNIEQIQESIIDFCQHMLKAGGVVLTKIFQGESAKLIEQKYKQVFNQVQLIKPPASRVASKEVFLLARGFVKKN